MVMAVSFERYGRLYYLDPGDVTPRVGDKVLVPTGDGTEVAECVWAPAWVEDEIGGLPRLAGIAADQDLERRQKSRATRTQRDALDRALLDLAAFYRDVLVAQLGAPVELVNGDLVRTVERLAGSSTPESTLRRIEAVLACREAVGTNVAPLLAVEAMALALHQG